MRVSSAPDCAPAPNRACQWFSQERRPKRRRDGSRPECSVIEGPGREPEHLETSGANVRAVADWTRRKGTFERPAFLRRDAIRLLDAAAGAISWPWEQRASLSSEQHAIDWHGTHPHLQSVRICEARGGRSTNLGPC
jgi:hypothetical protein